MKKIYFAIIAVVVLSAFVVAAKIPMAFAARPPQNPCPITSNTDIVIYGDTGFGGVGTLSKSWITHFMTWWKSYDSSIDYVFVDKNDVKSDCGLASFPNVKLYIQPGGNAYYQQNSLGSAGRSNILNYLNANGAYLGICAGFFYAAGDYYWQGEFYDWPGLLGVFPTVEGSITDIADYDVPPGYALTPLSNGFNAIYYGGPTRGWRDTPNTLPEGAQKIASFSAVPNELPALVQNGKMLLTSVHLEAFENDGISGLTTEQRTENYKLLANLINQAAGTNFYVPAYTTPPQCSDGVDNDGDTLIDYLADPGCASANDNDETDPLPTQCSDGIDNDGDGFIDFPADVGCTSLEDDDETDPSGPVTLFSDGFESGLSGWTLTKQSGANYWTAATVNPYEGTRHAQSQPMSTNEPASNMERTISTVGYGTITFSYYRRLIGLDAADEFKAKWFDGTNWNVLEQTGSNSANDAAYVFKTFNLPSNAGNKPGFKVRFECTAGATSEYCRVDNVKVTGQ